jgi:hypothetical protein
MRLPNSFLFLPLSALIGLFSNAVFAAENAAPRTDLPRGADGHPSFAGIWTGGTLTPYERPPQLANTTTFAKEELAERQKQSAERFWQAGHVAGEVGRDNDAFIDDNLKILASGQTSLVVEPVDGIVPLLPAGEQQRKVNLSNLDSYETMSQWDRCITRQPTALFPVVYNNAYQIIQTSDHIIIVSEMVHDARVIPLHGGQHIDARVTGWSGDSRAHWEGATLVIDTTNFNEHGWIATGGNSGRIRGMPYGSKLHLVERLTLTDRKTLSYKVTIEDPDYYSAPWSLAYPLVRDDQYQMYEYACHEGNTAVQAILGGARVQEAHAAEHASAK